MNFKTDCKKVYTDFMGKKLYRLSQGLKALSLALLVSFFWASHIDAFLVHHIKNILYILIFSPIVVQCYYSYAKLEGSTNKYFWFFFIKETYVVFFVQLIAYLMFFVSLTCSILFVPDLAQIVAYCVALLVLTWLTVRIYSVVSGKKSKPSFVFVAYAVSLLMIHFEIFVSNWISNIASSYFVELGLSVVMFLFILCLIKLLLIAIIQSSKLSFN